MPGQTLSTAAFVLEKRPPTDAFQSLLLFSPQHGHLRAMQRVPRKPSASHVSPDLFDEVAGLLESSNQGRTWFVKEVRVTRRHDAIGRSYDVLRFASALAAVIGRNQVGEESREPVAHLLSTALDAFDAGARPDVVYLKSLYRFARDEGYPVKQEWLPALEAEERAAAIDLLNQPVAGQTQPAEVAVRLRRSLEDYLGANTEILIP